MNLEELRAQARAVATRMEARIGTALGANREMTADEEAANTADEGELAGLKEQIATAEAAASPSPPADPTAAAVTSAVTAERERISALVDLCPSSVVATPLKKAISEGQEPGVFAIGLAQSAKARGASVDDLRAGAVQPGQLPNARKPGDDKPKTGAERGAGIVARAAALGHSAVAHLAPRG